MWALTLLLIIAQNSLERSYLSCGLWTSGRSRVGNFMSLWVTLNAQAVRGRGCDECTRLYLVDGPYGAALGTTFLYLDYRKIADVVCMSD